jgi:hypothetical protein
LLKQIFKLGWAFLIESFECSHGYFIRRVVSTFR